MTVLFVGLLIPLLGTMLGAAFVFFMKEEMSVRLQKSLLGFASGVMVAWPWPSPYTTCPRAWPWVWSSRGPKRVERAYPWRVP